MSMCETMRGPDGVRTRLSVLIAALALALPVYAMAPAALADEHGDATGAAMDETMGETMERETESAAGKAMGFMAELPSGAMRAGDLMDADVLDNNGETVGTVADLVMDQNGQLAGVIIASGGFMGIGEKQVAHGWDGATMKIRDGKLHTQLTKDEIAQAPAYKRAGSAKDMGDESGAEDY